MLWDNCIELGIEVRKKFREFGHHYARTGRDAQEQWFFDPFVPDRVTVSGQYSGQPIGCIYPLHFSSDVRPDGLGNIDK